MSIFVVRYSHGGNLDFKPLSGSFQLRTLHCRATLICASFGGLIIYYHFRFHFHHSSIFHCDYIIERSEYRLQCLSSQSVDCGSYKHNLCLCVCPAFTTYISLTMGRILIKFCDNVGTQVQSIALKFHKNELSVDVIMTSFLYFKINVKGSISAQRTTTLQTILLRQTVTRATAILFMS